MIGYFSATWVLTAVEREKGLESKRHLTVVFSVQVNRYQTQRDSLINGLPGYPHRCCNGSHSKLCTKFAGKVWTALRKSSFGMDRPRYFPSLKSESLLIQPSNCFVTSIHIAWAPPYSVFEIPSVFLGIRAMLRHPLHKRRGTFLCCIFLDPRCVGLDGVRCS